MKLRALVFLLEWVLANALVLEVLDDRYSFYAVPWILWNITFGIFLFKLYSAPEDETSPWPIGPTVGAFGFVLTATRIRDPRDDEEESGGSVSWHVVLGCGVCLLGFALIGVASDALGDEWRDAPPPESGADAADASDGGDGEATKLLASKASESSNDAAVHIPNLVTTGPYGVVRHPIYCGLLLEALGSNVVGGFSSGVAVGALCAVAAAYVTQLGQEERELEALLNEEYKAYKEMSKYKLIPFVY